MMALTDAATAHDCCDEPESSGTPCKSGHLCQTGGQHFSAVTLDVLPQEQVTATRFPHGAANMPSFDPPTAGRPPAQF